jgi:hypothetical protein
MSGATSFGKKNIDLVRIRVAGWMFAQRVTRFLLPVLLVLTGWHVARQSVQLLGLGLSQL